ncbi:Collagen alpha-1(XIX) chain, partial [Bienertia sinuspersici]
MLLIRNIHDKEPILVAWEKPMVMVLRKLRMEQASESFLWTITTDSNMAELAYLLRGLEHILESGRGNVWLEGDGKTLIIIITNNRTIKSLEAQ